METNEDSQETTRVGTLVIGGGQSGLSVGRQLGARDLPYTVVDANPRVGDAWRNRWDSFRLFTPSRLDGLQGMPQPGYHWRFPSKNEMADYLESYAARFDIPVRTGVRVERLYRDDGRFAVETTDGRLEADNVVVAMSSWQLPKVPEFADELSDDIRQLTASDYRNPDQLAPGRALVVGAGNSGAEIALELARTHDVALAGSFNGVLPFRPEGVAARVLMPVVARVLFHRLLSVQTPVGRKARPKMQNSGEPLIRVKPGDLAEAGVERVGRVTGVDAGGPQLEDGRRLDVENVVWCTGYRPGFDWIDLPVFGQDRSWPEHRSGIVDDLPGLYFVGLKFLHSVSSEQIHGVGRDAARVADAISARSR